MLFPHSFWGGLDMFGRIAPCVAHRGEYFLFYSYTHISGGEVHLSTNCALYPSHSSSIICRYNKRHQGV